MSLKTENSRHVAKSRPVCMDLKPNVKSVNNLSTDSAARHLLIKHKSIQRLKP
jgi:hypothetical protein